jgi:hypothetical protein
VTEPTTEPTTEAKARAETDHERAAYLQEADYIADVEAVKQALEGFRAKARAERRS